MDTSMAIELVEEDGILLAIDLGDGMPQLVTYEILNQYWPYANPEEIESIWVRPYAPYVVILLTTAQGQGGAVFVWDTQAEKLIHAGNGSYGLCAAVTQKQVITLHEVSNFVVPRHITYSIAPLGEMDVWNGFEVQGTLYTPDLSDETDWKNAEIHIEDDAVYFGAGHRISIVPIQKG